MKIVLLIAMDQEADYVSKEIKKSNWKIGNHIVYVERTGIGKVNAAMCCTRALEKYSDIDLVINTGLAGGLRTTMRPGDIVIGEKFIQHDVNAVGFGFILNCVPGLPRIFEGAHLSDLLERAALKNEFRDSKSLVFKGIVASGDQFINDSKRSYDILMMTDGVAVDMEAAAIAQVCYSYGVPFISLKTVSDAADAKAKDEFYKNLGSKCRLSGSIVLDFIKKLEDKKNGTMSSNK